MLGDLIEGTDDTQAWQGCVDFQSEAFPCEVIDDAPCSDSLACRQLIVYKIHCPFLIGRCEYRFLHWCGFQAFSGSATDFQFRLAIQPLNTFSVDGSTFVVQQEP